MIDDIESVESSDIGSTRMVKCSWCGEIMEVGYQGLAVAMCQICYTRMLADFQKAQRQLSESPHASDR